jgi:hydrogenase expression/formation protein HypE
MGGILDKRAPAILLDHGSGGRASRRLVEETILPHLRNTLLDRLDDAAVLSLDGARLAFTTDSYVVDPIFFPGGDIGMLAVHGTINDLAMSGARPVALSAGLILEEGLPLADLDRVMASMARAAKAAGVPIVTGDTKVVARGAADKIFINTAGIGVVPPGVDISGHHGRPGDAVILSGPIAEHGVAILSTRAGLSFASSCKSDTAPLAALVAEMLDACPAIHSLRDPTRGGLAATLHELASQSRVRIEIDEAAIPISEAAASACEMLGIDPLHLANEGVLVALVPSEHAASVVDAMHANPLGGSARVIGKVVDGDPLVVMRTMVGGKRMVALPSGQPLPRIC